MPNINLYPGTRILLSLSFVVIVSRMPVSYQAIAVLLGGIISFGLARRLSSRDPAGIFLRLWITAGLFLLIIHCISYDGSLLFNQQGLQSAGRSFFRIGSLMVAFLWIIRTMKTEELYAMLVDFHWPVPLIYLIFQSVFLIPKFEERAKEILVAQQARGFVLKGILNRITAITLILSPLFSITMYELEEAAASLSARGLYAPGKKSHAINIKFTSIDAVVLTLSSLMLCVVFVWL